MLSRTLRWFFGSAFLPTLALISACTINPVTGDRELALVSPATELSIGAAQYAPSRQMQGGDYVLDMALINYVQGVGQRLAAVSDRDLPYEFTVLNSSVPNAWALPGGKIAINRGLLLELGSEAELAAVLGHEIVHAAARHGALAMQRGMLLQGALLATSIAADRGNYSNLAVGAASVGAQLINQRNGRGAELESDEYGMLYMSRAGYDPAAAVDLQETFVRLSANRSNQGWLAGLFASHPPSQDRVDRNRETAAGLPAGGEMGRERYQAAIAGLRSSAPAYAAYDEARAALADDRVDDARTLALRALDAVPAEANFHSLLGDIEYSERNFAAAAQRYRAAIDRNRNFFYYPLRLGFTLEELDELTAAEAELERSLTLLPTADAHYGLGVIKERRGDTATALAHYREAAGASSQTGQAAQDAVVRIELPENPSAFLQMRSGLDSAGMLQFELGNPTRFSVTDIAVSIRFVDGSGRTQTVSNTIYSTLEPSAVERYNTGIGPLAGTQSYEIILNRARIIQP